MKRIIIALSLLSFHLSLFTLSAQTDWKKIDNLIVNKSYKTAYTQAEVLFKKTTNSTDLLTAAWYMARAAAEYQEDCYDSSIARYRSILPRLEPLDRAVCYAFLGINDSALLDEELWKRTPSDRIRHFCEKTESKGVNLTPTAFDVVAQSILNNDPYNQPLLQKLIDFHRDDNDYIRMSLDMQMLDILASNPNEMSQEKRLQGYINKYRGSNCPLLTQFYQRMARYLDNNDRKVEALRYCDTAIALFPKSSGGADCANLRSSIQRVYIGFSNDENNTVAYPGRPSLHKVSYENLSLLHLALFPYDGSDVERFLKRSVKPLHQWQLAVKNDGLHSRQTLLFDLPPLPAGRYLLLASSNGKFSSEDAYLVLQCFDFALCNTGDGEFLMVDAVTGAPVEGQNVILLDRRKKVIDTVVTYPDGRFRLPVNRDIRTFRIERGGTYEQGVWSFHHSDTERKMTPQAHLVSDRPIYRPGDTVRFATVLYESDRLDGRILAGRNATLVLQDPNGKKQGQRELVSDAHGVVSTTFVIPSDALAGDWYVKLSSGTVSRMFYLRVEEYKQPKFMVTLNAPQSPSGGRMETPCFGKPYTFRGLAQAYSGVDIADARVKYTVSRSVHWTRWYPNARYTHWEYVDSTVTAADGSFDITFTPLPDSTVDFSRKPVFNYTVHVEVTDLTGETHEASTSLCVGFSNEQIALSTETSQLSSRTFCYSFRDLNGNPLEGDVQLKVERLRLPDTLRLEPEIFGDLTDPHMSLGRDEYRRRFPNYVYSPLENNPSQWQAVWRHSVNHHADGSKQKYSVDLSVNELPSGVYRLIARAGEATDTQYVTLVLPHERTLPTADLLWAEAPDEVEVGGTCKVRYASAFDDTRIFYLLSGPDGREIASQWISADRRIRSFSIPVDSVLLGGFQINFVTIRDGVSKSWRHTVKVPFTHKKLKVDISTFRDKLLPGEQEEWTIKVKGETDDTANLSPLTSHLVMTMYDDALNSYRMPSSWSFSPWRSCNYRSVDWSGLSSTFSSYYQPLNYLHYYDPTTYSLSLVNGLYQGYPYGYIGRNVKNLRAPLLEMVAVSADDGYEMYAAGKGVARSKQVAANRESVEVEEEVAEMEIFTVVEKEETPDIQVRSNLSTLAFFVSDLRIDSTGTAIYRFRVPELLTRWSIKGLAFTDDLKIGTLDKSLVTQKPLMVQPNIPRFLRHGDSLVLMAKVVNLSDDDRQVRVLFSLNNQNTPMILKEQIVAVPAQGSAQATFPISNLPRDLYVATYEITAQTLDEQGPQYSDGERGQIPVVSSRQAVTLSQPIYINGVGEKSFAFHLSPLTSTAEPHFLGAELVSNPIWLAIKSMPYFQETGNPSNLYLANRLYVNTLGQGILKGFKGLKSLNDLADTSNTRLKINEDVKQTLLEATPWLRDAESEVEQRQAIANYFDSTRMAEELERIQNQLDARQNNDGGWSWMPDGESSLWVTEQVLKRINLSTYQLINIEKALAYIDREEQRHYEKYIKPYLKKGYKWSPDNIDYLYTRSHYGNGKTEAYKFYYGNALKNYKSYNGLYTQAQLALIFQRHGDNKAACDIIRRLKEKSLESDEMGMYWRDNKSGWCWYERPIETQALLIQAFAEVTPQDTTSIALMQQWLLKQKQTNHWGNDRATVEAIKALLVQNTPSTPILQNNQITLKVCGTELSAPSEGLEGYRSQRWQGPALDSIISLNDSTITLRKETSGIAWGAVYFQYTDDMDKIPSSESGITLKRSYFPEGNWKVGDRVKVHIEISCDRAMEYLELIDGRPSCVEPVSTRSGWNWNQGLRYYVEVKNTATHCYINRLEKGKYVVEYDVFVTNPGTFLAGPVTLQCMYAPEFRATAPAERFVIR